MYHTGHTHPAQDAIYLSACNWNTGHTGYTQPAQDTSYLSAYNWNMCHTGHTQPAFNQNTCNTGYIHPAQDTSYMSHWVHTPCSGNQLSICLPCTGVWKPSCVSPPCLKGPACWCFPAVWSATETRPGTWRNGHVIISGQSKKTQCSLMVAGRKYA